MAHRPSSSTILRQPWMKGLVQLAMQPHPATRHRRASERDTHQNARRCWRQLGTPTIPPRLPFFRRTLAIFWNARLGKEPLCPCGGLAPRPHCALLLSLQSWSSECCTVSATSPPCLPLCRFISAQSRILPQPVALHPCRCLHAAELRPPWPIWLQVRHRLCNGGVRMSSRPASSSMHDSLPWNARARRVQKQRRSGSFGGDRGSRSGNRGRWQDELHL